MSFSKEDIIGLINSYNQNTISDEGIKHLENWLAENETNADEFANYLALLKESGAISSLTEIKTDVAWSRIIGAVSATKRQSKNRKLHFWLPYAAAVVVMCVVGYLMVYQVEKDYNFDGNYNFAEISTIGSKKAVLILNNGNAMNLEENLDSVIAEVDGTLIQNDGSNALTYKKSSSQQNKLIYNQINIPRGGEYSLTLADGTKVWLNSESSLKYPVQFIGEIRKVELTGEAYFEVAHNKSKPFIIESHGTEVKVLGTKFNVSAYNDEEDITTTLVEGSVQVSSLGNSELLEPGYQAVVKRGRSQFQVNKVNADLYTSWINGVFQFKNQSLEEICHQLSRWYNVEFFFTENQYRNLRFAGAAKKDKELDFTLEIIEKMADVKFAIKDNKVIVGKPY
ncbi:FecR domain-containing protein [Labilibaculum manganireducens]|uniref:FecR family protein n=1 Tax=Labilibaculum manganireducens TaxID=1940525 RepID=UPI0029F538EC|nr:FecR domain-containing protein [Labilibaculum manganireducens]